MLPQPFVGPHDISNTYGGWFHVYSFTMFTGILVSILVSWYKLHRHRIPTDGLVMSVIFIIPASLFGASFLGKDDPLNPMSFFSKFAFWKGGLSIHGGVLFGVIAGIIFFGFVSRKTKVSMWIYGDCIIPNILLGQVIGRWGNFFNHELLGDIVGYSKNYGDASHISAISWLPAWIRDNCFKLDTGGSPEMINGQYVFRAPIFLYESMANLGFWILLTFLVPRTFKWFSAKKPWKTEADRFKILTIKEIDATNYELVKNQEKNFVTYSFKWIHYKLIFIKNRIILAFKNHPLKRKYWYEAFDNQRASEFELKNIQENYEIEAVRENSLGAYFKRSKALYHAYNPHGYFEMRSGVQMWLYFFGWNLIRFCLEMQRSEGSDLFIMNRRALDYTVLILIFVVGLIMAILSQFVIARFFRKEKWTYEKEY